MAEPVDPDLAAMNDGTVVQDMPRGHLPPMTYRDLPEPLPLRKTIGPGVVLAAAGIGSGEYVLWPYIAQRVGLDFLWAALFGCILMFFIATECIRYTLATGETIITGFTRLWKFWWIGFVLMALMPNFWPSFATGVGTLTSYIFGFGDGAALMVTIFSLIAVALSLILSPVVYNMMEKSQTVMMGIMLVFFVVAAVVASVIDISAWADLASGFGSVGTVPSGIPFATLAGAVAFAGAGGTGVLMASNYVRDKGMGMGVHIPRITSPITGADEPGSNIGHFFPESEDNVRRWRSWWKSANLDQFLTFFLFTVVGIFVFSILAYATLFGGDVGEGFDFIKAEGLALGERFGTWLTYFFWSAGVVALFSTNLALWDGVSRICADAIKANALLDSRFWSESRIYAAIIAGLFVSSVAVLMSGLQQPLVLFVIAAVLNGAVTFVSCTVILQLNRFSLPDMVRMGKARFAVMAVATLFYGAFFIITVINVFKG